MLFAIGQAFLLQNLVDCISLDIDRVLWYGR